MLPDFIIASTITIIIIATVAITISMMLSWKLLPLARGRGQVLPVPLLRTRRDGHFRERQDRVLQDVRALGFRV